MREVKRMRQGLLLALLAAVALPGWAATNNSGNAPTFLHIDICTNAIGDRDVDVQAVGVPRMEPDIFDIGVDLGADGTIDRWLSQEKTEFFGGGNQDDIMADAWQRFYIRLDTEAGKQAKIRIVDNSEDYYMAINAIRLNFADGTVVPNLVPNGFFEDDPPLNGWTILSGSITDPASLILTDEPAFLTIYGTKFFSTRTDPFSVTNSETVVVESDTFTLEPPTSFVYGMVSGGGSELWNKPGAIGSDNASGVYLDFGTATEDPNGQYDDGVDIPLIGFFGGPAENVRNNFHPVILNTSGLEGRRCQVVAIDNSEAYHVGMDSWRMNFDNEVIVNGGFDDGIPTPEEDPDAISWFLEEVLEWNEHPSGSIPGWTVTQTGEASVFFFDKAVRSDHMSGYTWVGTAGFAATDRAASGVELRSDVFVIEPIPDPAQSVFLQLSSAQGIARFRYNTQDLTVEQGRLELRVDVNGNAQFDDDADFAYVLINQGQGHNVNFNTNMDLWAYPDYRFYIKPEHQGLQAQIYVEDTLGPTRPSYGWMAVDDFFLWNGSEVVQPFPNSDFEMGDLTNWTEEVGINGGDLVTWLGGSQEAFVDGLVLTTALNDKYSMADGNFCAETCPDQGTGTLISVPFALPSIVAVAEWSLF